MKLILTFCLVIFSVQYSEQVGYEGTHVYHDGDDVHEHHPLPPDVVQISRGHYMRPDQNSTQETSENLQTENKHDKLENVQENSNNTEIKNGSNVILTPNIDKNDTDSQNSSSKENNDGNRKKEQLNENETDKAPTSSKKEGDANTIEKRNENTSTQNNTIDEIHKDIPKMIHNNGSVGADISHGLEHGQTQKIYETYPEACEEKTGKKFNKTQNGEKTHEEINSINVGNHDDKAGNLNNSQNKTNENNNNSVDANVESEGDKNKLYDNYPDAFEGITGKTYNGSRENNSTIQLEHEQTQKIYDTYPEAYEKITGNKYNGSQPADNDIPHKESTSNNANSGNNTPGEASQENQSIVSHENSTGTSGNKPSISDINGGNHESTEGVKQPIPHGGTSITIQVGKNHNCNLSLVNCNGQGQTNASSTTNVNNGTSSKKPSHGIQIIINANGKGNPANAAGHPGKISDIVVSLKHQPAKQIPCPPATSVKNVLLSQFRVKRSLQAV